MLIKQAVIVCGGLGSRLGIITKKTPKPLIKVNGKTVIEHIIKNLSRFGISEVLLLCGYKNILFKKKFHNKSFFGIKIKCIIEKKLLGTSGALLNAKKYLKNFFLYCNGDTFFDYNFNNINLNKLQFEINLIITKNHNYKENKKLTGLKLLFLI